MKLVSSLQVFYIMLKDEGFYPAFKTTKAYMKLLAELDLLEATNISVSSQEDVRSLSDYPATSPSTTPAPPPSTPVRYLLTKSPSQVGLLIKKARNIFLSTFPQP